MITPQSYSITIPLDYDPISSTSASDPISLYQDPALVNLCSFPTIPLWQPFWTLLDCFPAALVITLPFLILFFFHDQFLHLCLFLFIISDFFFFFCYFLATSFHVCCFSATNILTSFFIFSGDQLSYLLLLEDPLSHLLFFFFLRNSSHISVALT